MRRVYGALLVAMLVVCRLLSGEAKARMRMRLRHGPVQPVLSRKIATALSRYCG